MIHSGDAVTCEACAPVFAARRAAADARQAEIGRVGGRGSESYRRAFAALHDAEAAVAATRAEHAAATR
jgi:hypothetical protein